MSRRLPRRMVALLGAIMLGGVVAGHAEATPVVVELFTSQGCSSCPPADAFLTELARTRPDVLSLAFHVTYWDYLGWHDPFALPAGTARQKAYAAGFGDDQIYTPEMVVAGQRGLVGSDRPAVLDAIARAAADRGADISLSLGRDGQGIVITVGAGAGPARVLLVGFDPQHRTPIGRGENGGRTLLESNIVRSLTVAADWTGAPLRIRQVVPAGLRFAVLLQAEDGRILGAAAP
jgi:hypothetical protein